jgi:CheY-like chemotaxis protein
VGDAQRLRQCVMNLVNNAVKFTPEGGRILLTYRGEAQDATHILAEFDVSDNGVGMSEAFMHKLFTPFEQEQNSLYNAYAGSGLGLSIVHEFVELMGGTITARSKKGEGSTFVIRLPLETTPKAVRARPEITDAELSDRIGGRRVLLVEDNAINRQILAMLLEKMGLSVDEAENGLTAVTKFRASAPGGYAIILMDIMMPVMGGLEATAAIRRMERPDAETVPIIALSANAFVEDARKSLAAGMQMHLAKPVNVKELRRVLQIYLK